MDLGDQIESIVVGLNLPYYLRISILVLHSDKSSCLGHTWELLKVSQDTGMMPIFFLPRLSYQVVLVGGNGERRSDWNIVYIGPTSAANPEIHVEDARSKRPRVPTASEARIASIQHGDVGMVR